MIDFFRNFLVLDVLFGVIEIMWGFATKCRFLSFSKMAAYPNFYVKNFKIMLKLWA